MPVERQWARMHTPLSRRDKLLLGALTLAAMAAVIAAFAFRHPAHGTGRCVVVSLPATMGGATVHRCGADAREFCRTQGRADVLVAEACRAKGFRQMVGR